MPAALHEEHSFAAHAAGRKQNPFSGGACTTERICAFFRRGVYVEKLLAERRDAHLPWASGTRARRASHGAPVHRTGAPDKGEVEGAEVPSRNFYTRIHEKQDNCLVLIAPTARWILMRRTDAQSAAVPIKISYFNGRVVLRLVGARFFALGTEIELFRLLLYQQQLGPQAGQGLLRVSQGIEEQQIFLSERHSYQLLSFSFCGLQARFPDDAIILQFPSYFLSEFVEKFTGSEIFPDFFGIFCYSSVSIPVSRAEGTPKIPPVILESMKNKTIVLFL